MFKALSVVAMAFMVTMMVAIALLAANHHKAALAGPTYTEAQQTYLAALERDTGTNVLEPQHMFTEADNVCRSMTTIHHKSDLIAYLGAYALANYDGRGTMTGKIVADMMLYACPATGERIVSIYKSGV